MSKHWEKGKGEVGLPRRRKKRTETMARLRGAMGETSGAQLTFHEPGGRGCWNRGFCVPYPYAQQDCVGGQGAREAGSKGLEKKRSGVRSKRRCMEGWELAWDLSQLVSGSQCPVCKWEGTGGALSPLSRLRVSPFPSRPAWPARNPTAGRAGSPGWRYRGSPEAGTRPTAGREVGWQSREPPLRPHLDLRVSLWRPRKIPTSCAPRPPTAGFRRGQRGSPGPPQSRTARSTRHQPSWNPPFSPATSETWPQDTSGSTTAAAEGQSSSAKGPPASGLPAVPRPPGAGLFSPWFFIASCLGPREPFDSPDPGGTGFAVTRDFRLWGQGKRASLGNCLATQCSHGIFSCVALGKSVSPLGLRRLLCCEVRDSILLLSLVPST